MPQLTAALIGTGAIAKELHIRAHRKLSLSKLKWVCGSNMESAETFAKEYDIPFWTGNFKDVLQDPEVSWVDIASPSNSHAPLAIRALESGKHVLCQKPLAVSSAEARQMVSSADKAARQLGVYMCFRGDKGLQLLNTLVKEGKFGSIISFRGKMISGNGFNLKEGQWRMDHASGALDLLGVHLIDLFLWFHGDIQWAQSYSSTLRAPITGDDVTSAIYGFADGVTAVMETSYSSFVNPNTPLYYFEINGTKGTARYRLETGELEIVMKDDYECTGFTYTAGELLNYRFHSYISEEGVDGVHQAFAQCLVSGNPFDVDGAVGVKALCIIEATRKAAKEGRKVIISY